MKKILGTALAFVLSAVSAVPVFADAKPTFSDISKEKYKWAAGYIEEMSEMGFISGYEDGTYRPDNSVTRLEALSLFARAMGSNSEANKEALKNAEEEYLSVVEEYELNFGSSDIAYLLYRGALKQAELPAYIGEDARNVPMPRHEAAVVITKAMCAEREATSEIMVDLDYKDVEDIPAKARQYVYYVTKKEIMAGMGDGNFSPETSVLRSQIAVMLSKTVDLMNLTVESLKIADIDGVNLSYYDENNEIQQMGYNANTRFYVEGELVQAKNIPVGVEADLTYVDNQLVYVDIANAVPDQKIEGIFNGYSSSNGVVTVSVLVDGKIKDFTFGDDVELTFQGQSATMRSFTKSDYVKMELTKGKIKKLSGEPKINEIKNATVEEITIVEDGTMTISHALPEYDGLKLEVASNVKVTKNEELVLLADVYKGDKVTLTLEYGVVTKILAESATKVVEGVINTIEISSSPKMTVTIKGKEEVYDVTPGVEIIINDKEGTIYDFRVGDTVVITTESKAIKKIVAKSVQVSAHNRDGVVSAVNASYGFIKVKYVENDTTFEETVYCKNAKFITSEGVSKTVKDISEGDTVSVRGTMANGAFEASLIIIEIE